MNNSQLKLENAKMSQQLKLMEEASIKGLSQQEVQLGMNIITESFNMFNSILLEETGYIRNNPIKTGLIGAAALGAGALAYDEIDHNPIDAANAYVQAQLSKTGFNQGIEDSLNYNPNYKFDQNFVNGIKNEFDKQITSYPSDVYYGNKPLDPNTTILSANGEGRVLGRMSSALARIK